MGYLFHVCFYENFSTTLLVNTCTHLNTAKHFPKVVYQFTPATAAKEHFGFDILSNLFFSSFVSFCFVHFSHLGGCILVSWEIDGETLETVADFIFGGSKIIVDGDRKSTRLNSSHIATSRMPSSA